MPRNNIMLAICCIVLFATLTHNKQIVVKNQKFYDKQNRQVTLHGANVVVKVPPYIPDTGSYNSLNSFGPDDIQNLKVNGFNSIRLGVMWAGVQPQKDTYNETYLKQMVNIVNSAGEAGIYTLVEFHQDLLSQTFCGDGVPIWLVQQLKLYKTFPWPMKGKNCTNKSWSNYYFSYDVAQGFNELYNPNHKLNHKFVQYWIKVVQTFKGNPYVIAYQLINEPWVGNLWRNPTLIIPSMAERAKLQNLYDQLSQAIRPIDSETPLCFQPVTFDNFVPAGFSHPPGGNKYQNSSILCYHHYQPPAIGLKSIDTYVHDAKKLGIGSLLSETYGSAQTLDRAQYWKQSWMYWIYKGFDNRDLLFTSPEQLKLSPPLDQVLQGQNLNMAQNLIRTYLTRVAGQLQKSSYNSTTKHFMATYWASPAGISILYLNKERIYGGSYEITVIPSGETKVTQEGNYISIQYMGKQEGKRIMVTVNKV